MLPGAEETYLLYDLTDCGVCFPYVRGNGAGSFSSAGVSIVSFESQ